LETLTLSVNIQLVLDLQSVGSELEYVPQAESSARFVGNPDQVVATVKQYEQLGVSHIMFNLSMRGGPQPSANVQTAMRILAHQVMPAF
jgi:hypothetical protein